MPAVMVSLADDVVTRLNAVALSQAFTATCADYAPDYDLTDLDTLKVVVVPRAIPAIVRESRSSHHVDYEVDIAIMQRVSASTRAVIDPLLLLVEEIVDRVRLMTSSYGSVVNVRNEPAYSAEYLREHRQFASIVTVTFRGFR